jgi:AcrR family transcriptional regulator
MESRAEQKARTRRKLIDSALQLSAKKGFAALSLREITLSSDVAPAAFYRHFNDLEDLGLVLVDEIALSLRRLLRNARKNSESSDRNSLTVFSIETFLDYINENANLFRLLLGERQGSSDTFRMALRKEIDQFVIELTEDLERMATARQEKLRHPAYAAEAIVAIVFTVGAEALDIPRHKQENLKNRLVEEVNMILRGCRDHSPQKKRR